MRSKEANLGVRPERGRRRRAALADGRAGEAAGARLQRHLPTIQFGKIHKFCHLLPNFRSARSRLYRSQILQVGMRWKALAEIYTMHSFAPFSNLKKCIL